MLKFMHGQEGRDSFYLLQISQTDDRYGHNEFGGGGGRIYLSRLLFLHRIV